MYIWIRVVRQETERIGGMETLRERRESLAMKFAEKCVKAPVFQKWFPLKTARRSTRNGGEVYLEEKARCERMKNSPMYYFRRLLNGKPGKTYGSRNNEYREDVVMPD